MKTQKQRVIEKLLEKGKVDNFWAFNNYILRLGAIIWNLRQQGIEITTHYKNIKGHKNCIYELVDGSRKQLVKMKI